MPEPLGIKIRYQAKPCLPAVFEYTRPAGLEPGRGSVGMLRENFRDFVIRESVPGVDTLEVKTQEKPTETTPGFLSSGSLMFQEVEALEDGGQKVHRVVWDQVLVTEKGAEVAYSNNTDANEVVHIELTDIRYLWETRGILSALINIPFQGIPEPASGGTQSKPVTTGKGPQVTPGSSDNGKPWTLERVLTQKIYPALPGDPKLTIQSPRPDYFDKTVGPKHWDGKLPKDAYREVLEEFQLVNALNFDATLSVWPKGRGELQLAGEASAASAATLAASAATPQARNLLSAIAKSLTINFSPSRPDGSANPAVDERVARSRRLVSYKHVPAVAVVVGPPVIVEARMRLEAVGEKNGRIVPLKDALAAIGLDMPRATKLAMLNQEERPALLGVSEHGVSEFNRWGFKWFRLPGGEAQNADKLPMLPARGAVASTGELLPQRVFSECHTTVRELDLLRRKTLTGGVARLELAKDQLKDIEDQIGNSGDLSQNARDNLKRKKDQLAGTVKNLEAYVEQETQKLAGGAAAAKAMADTLAAGLSKAQYLRSVRNIPFGEQTTGYHIDSDRGIVMFDAVQGRVAPEGVPITQAFLSESAAVEIEFAFRRKPTQNENLELGHRYFACFVRKGDGPTAVIEQRDKIPLKTAPLRIVRLELQQIDRLDGSSNKALLDVIAKQLAEQQLKVDQSTEGAVVEFCRPVPVLNTGAVLSVTWSMEKGKPKVVAHVSSTGHVTPAPSLRTRAFGGLDELDGGVMFGSVYMPKGPGR